MLKKYLHINCQKATMLIVKKEEVRLSLLDLIRLKYHQKICTICFYFEQQINFISKNAHKVDELNISKLTQQEKDAMQEKFIEQQKSL